MPGKPDNPYANAAGMYGDTAQKHTTNQSELEARVLLKSAKALQDIQSDWENLTSEILEDALKYNRQIWMLFYDTALENPENNRPSDLRSNILNLANFIFKREVEILTKPEKQKLDVLISVNREIAAGLMEQAKQATTGKENPTPSAGRPTTA